MPSSILMLISVCTMDVTQDTVLSMSGHYITGCPLLPLSSSRHHVSRVWEHDQYCIREEENIERCGINPSIFHILRDLLVRSMLKAEGAEKL